MSAFPNSEVPPPGTPDGHVPFFRLASVRGSHRERNGPPASATVRLCLVDPAADADEIVTAAVSMITTTYTAPGDRIMLADTGIATGPGRQRRDRLVESVLRLGRGATTTPDRQAHGDHESATATGGLPAAAETGSGLGPRRDGPAVPIANPTDPQCVSAFSGPGSDHFELIIAGWSDTPTDPRAMADSTPALAPSGTVVVLTHSHSQHRARAAQSRQLSRAATQAGLILTERLILAHQLPSTPRSIPPRRRRAIALSGHRRIHSTACVFRRLPPPAEAHHD